MVTTHTYITDTDFIDCTLKGDEYSLVYGVFQHISCHNELKEKYIYNLAIILCMKQDVDVLRATKVKQWMELLGKIIDKLNQFDEDVLVTIPFMDIDGYELNEILDAFRLEVSILNELLLNNFKELKLIDSCIDDCFPVWSLEDCFADLGIDIIATTGGALDEEDILDEMRRRGLRLPNGTSYRIQRDKNYYYEYYTDSEQSDKRRFFKEKRGDDEDRIIEVKESDIKRIGVIYYMLKDALKDNQELLVKVANYVLGKDYNPNLRANNSAYKYIHNPALLINKAEKVEYIKKQLVRYNIEIPEELTDGKKNLEKLE